MQDLHHSLTTLNALDTQTIATDTTTAGNIIDRAAKEALEFVFYVGTVTDGTYNVLIEHGDDSGLSDNVAVPDNMLLGTELEAALTGDDTASEKIGYVGDKRYVRASIVSTLTTTGATGIGAVALLGHPWHRDEPV